MLQGEVVPRGEHDGAGVRGEAEAEHVHVGPRARPEAESAAVEVDEHRQLVPGGIADADRPVHAYTEVLGLVVDGLLPLHRWVAVGEGGQGGGGGRVRPEPGRRRRTGGRRDRDGAQPRIGI
ncbi:hypothetical protein PVAP13_6KG167712 [Panicum virgatum]|uniref:Uncharacterized protein n=1 Tax=Panicum virgatum TaxID=38727 RepID=A0A8T0RD41_PANVG|nr:hypothetical protein PVAP13_6KG167712 [Panicum virgatum]